MSLKIGWILASNPKRSQKNLMKKENRREEEGSSSQSNRRTTRKNNKKKAIKGTHLIQVIGSRVMSSKMKKTSHRTNLVEELSAKTIFLF